MKVPLSETLVLLMFLPVSVGTEQDPERGRIELRRVKSLAAHPQYGNCWARALEHLDTRCREMTSESQSRMALMFTYCHLSSSGRDFPSCPEGADIRSCTASMDAVAFNTYTEFFTHTHSICHFLQSEVWQSRAENTMHRLTESSAGVAEQLQSTREVAEELMDAQSAALQAQQEILDNGKELRLTLRDSIQGLRSIFTELSSVSREQQVALSELFNRVSFLQSFLMMEAHSMSSCLYNAAALCASFLLTSTHRSSRARFLLMGLVCLNFYLERKIYQFVLSSDHPEHQHMELVSVYVSVLRQAMVVIGACILLRACIRYQDPIQEVLQQLRETQNSLQEALQHAENLSGRQNVENDQQNMKESRKRTEVKECSPLDCSTLSDLSHISWSLDSLLSSTVDASADATLVPDTTHNTTVQNPSPQKVPMSPSRRPHRSSSARRVSSSSSSPLVYSILVEDKQPRYSLRSRRSETPQKK